MLPSSHPRMYVRRMFVCVRGCVSMWCVGAGRETRWCPSWRPRDCGGMATLLRLHTWLPPPWMLPSRSLERGQKQEPLNEELEEGFPLGCLLGVSWVSIRCFLLHVQCAYVTAQTRHTCMVRTQACMVRTQAHKHTLNPKPKHTWTFHTLVLPGSSVHTCKRKHPRDTQVTP
jgi:hypothetical protein